MTFVSWPKIVFLTILKKGFSEKTFFKKNNYVETVLCILKPNKNSTIINWALSKDI